MGSINVGKSYCHYNPQVQCHELFFIKKQKFPQIGKEFINTFIKEYLET